MPLEVKWEHAQAMDLALDFMRNMIWKRERLFQQTACSVLVLLEFFLQTARLASTHRASGDLWALGFQLTPSRPQLGSLAAANFLTKGESLRL